MSLMATTCGVCHSVLVLQNEHFDKIDKVFVGELQCSKCGRRYIDQRHQNEVRPAELSTSTDDVALSEAFGDPPDRQHPPVSPKGPTTMRLFDLDAVGIYLDTYSPRGEKTAEGETEVLDLTLRVQPFTPKLATAFDNRVRARLFSHATGEQDPIIAELKLRGLDPPKQDVTVFLLPENMKPQIAFFDVECSDFRVRTERGVDGYALVFYATVGPLGASELEEIYKWHRQQRFLTFNKSQSVLNFEAKDAETVTPEPPRPGRKAKPNGRGEDASAP